MSINALYQKIKSDPKLMVLAVVGVCVTIYILWSVLKSPEVKEVHHKAEPARSSKPTLVLHWAKWCNNCTVMKDDWNKAAKIVGDTGMVDIVELEADDDKAATDHAVKERGLKGFPEIKYYPNGYDDSKHVSFSGDRTEDNIVKFVYENMEK